MQDHHYMNLAIQLAARGRGETSPNPMVGCVFVKNNSIIAQGWHQRCGEAHAEINAINNAIMSLEGASVYVSLEPCCHYGKTPPCVDALIKARVKEVFIASLDPNPLMNGQGAKALRDAGIEVHTGMQQTAARQLNESYFHYQSNRKPFVIAKWAMSLDGKIATHTGQSQWISHPTARLHAHELRSQIDAILVGAHTARRDNPRLTCRLEQVIRQPLRIVLSRSGNLPLDLKLFDTTLPGKTLVATSAQADKTWLQQIKEKNIQVIIIKQNEHGKLDLNDLLLQLGQLNITSLIVEGGSQTLTQFYEQRLLNKFYIYMAPKFIGGQSAPSPFGGLGIENMSEATEIHKQKMQFMDPDFLITGYFKEPTCLPA